MPLPFGIEPPRWLQDEVSWLRESGERSTNALTQSFFQGARLALDKQKQQFNMASGLLDLQAQEQGIRLNEINIETTSRDLETIPQWLKDHPTWESRQGSEWPTAMSTRGQAALDAVRINDANSMKAKTAVADIAKFTKGLDEIEPADRAAIKSMSANRDGTPSAMQWNALGLAEERSRVARENQRKAAEVEALQRGDVPTTTITDKGVSTTYEPAPVDKETEPKTKILDGGTQIVWMPGGKTLHVISPGGKPQELTPFQLSSIAKGLSDKDPRKKQISDFLADTALKQVTPKESAPSNSNSDPLGLFK